MTVVVLVHAVLSAVILAFHVALAAGCVANISRDRRARGAAGGPGPHLSVEVVVAVRNESASLPRLLAALREQTDRSCALLFVDDRSTDDTGHLLDEFCAAEGPGARVIHATAEPVGLTGKQAALDLAFDAARGDVLLFTDGDCAPPPGWVAAMSAPFRDPEVGVVLGRVELPDEGGFLRRFQAFEQPLLNQYNFGSAGIGVPTGCFGNNMAVRTSVLKATGGFRTLGYSVTEDALLLDAVARAGKCKVRVCTEVSAAIVTQPKPTWRGYVEQHTRWNAGAIFSPDPVTSISYIFIVLVYLVGSIVVMPLGVLDWRVPLLSLNAFFSIGILAALGGAYEGKDQPGYYLRLLPFLIFFGFFYSWITLRALVRRPFEWKGTTLRG
jgi:cellulose synthase/poly-beta-1,6-N-acetylglucosamine synthase-like glycosyltransferase